MAEGEGVTCIEIPLASGGGIAVGGAIAAALLVAVEGDVEVVVTPRLAPRPVPRGMDVAHVLHALVNGSIGDDVLLCCFVQGLCLGLAVGEGVAAAEGYALGQ